MVLGGDQLVDERRRRRLVAGVRQDASLPLRLGRLDGEPHLVALAREQALANQRLDGWSAAGDPRERGEVERPTRFDERTQRPRPTRRAPPRQRLDVGAGRLWRRRQSHDLDDARAASRAGQRVAALGQTALQQRRCRRSKPAPLEALPQLVERLRLLTEQAVQLALRGGQPNEVVVRYLDTREQSARPLASPGRQHQRVGLPRGSAVVLANPCGQLEAVRLDPRCGLDGRLQRAGLLRRITPEVHRPLDDDALQRPWPPRHVDNLARRDLSAGRHAVGEREVGRPPGVDRDFHVPRAIEFGHGADDRWASCGRGASAFWSLSPCERGLGERFDQRECAYVRRASFTRAARPVRPRR